MANTKSSSRKPTKQIHHNPQKLQENKPPSWSVFRSIITCKHLQTLPQQQQQPNQIQKQKQRGQEADILTEDNSNKSQKQKQKEPETAADTLAEEINHKKSKKMRCSGSICSNTKVMQRPEPSSSSPEEKNKKKKAAALSSSSSSSSFHDSSSRSLMKAPLNELTSCPSSNSFSAPPSVGNNSSGSSFRGMPFRRLSGCYECRMVVDPVLGFTRDPSLRSTICSCPDCGEIFMKAENLELHQAVRHAVSEMGPEDTSKNIVEIIFQSSWLMKQSPVCKIDRILKVHNTTKTVSNFEAYRDSIKSKANKLPKKHPRCIADGNELLRFHSTNFKCSLGLNGSSNLCNSTPNCEVCSIIKSGFKMTGKGILTTATSGKAHDSGTFMVADGGGDERRAMLVCRVIAGRVKKTLDGSMDEFDSVASGVGVYSNVDELYVFNPKAILPCFVVIYSGF